jgi:leucyl-tRNA synthetase
MQDKYSHLRWSAPRTAHWTANDAYRVTEDAGKKKFYACSMLPYPSGKLHMGHVRNYTINDMLTRQLRMKPAQRAHAHGLGRLRPAGRKRGAEKRRATRQVDLRQHRLHEEADAGHGPGHRLEPRGGHLRPQYYKWNQWLFLKMLERGIAYRKTQVVNWDPVDQTVLANEQVIDGKGWRTGAVVEKREIPGYYLKITDYAQELLDHVQIGNDKATLTGWPDKVRLMQENWIGKSEGVRFAFTHSIRGADGALIGDGKMYVFTTRADTIMGVTFAPWPPSTRWPRTPRASNPPWPPSSRNAKPAAPPRPSWPRKEKKGMRTGLFVTHPLTGAQVEVWVGNYVLMSYGDGAVMGVPAHDERDFAFALKYGIEIKQVVALQSFRWRGDGSAACGTGHTLTPAPDLVGTMRQAAGMPTSPACVRQLR